MGTRNLTIVIVNNKIKVAQYGQWDGYPSGQGATVLSFLKNADMGKFASQISKLKWFTKKDNDQIDKAKNWKNVALGHTGIWARIF